MPETLAAFAWERNEKKQHSTKKLLKTYRRVLFLAPMRWLLLPLSGITYTEMDVSFFFEGMKWMYLDQMFGTGRTPYPTLAQQMCQSIYGRHCSLFWEAS